MRKLACFSAPAFMLIATLAVAADSHPPTSIHVVATYFHRTLRCQTCIRIESLARYDVTDVMASDLESGGLEWRSLDFEEEQNAHFEDEYGLEGPTLVITIEDGDKVIKWARLDRVWEIYDDLEAFDEYVLGTVKEYLAAASEIESERARSR